MLHILCLQLNMSRQTDNIYFLCLKIELLQATVVSKIRLKAISRVSGSLCFVGQGCVGVDDASSWDRLLWSWVWMCSVAVWQSDSSHLSSHSPALLNIDHLSITTCSDPDTQLTDPLMTTTAKVRHHCVNITKHCKDCFISSNIVKFLCWIFIVIKWPHS